MEGIIKVKYLYSLFFLRLSPFKNQAEYGLKMPPQNDISDIPPGLDPSWQSGSFSPLKKTGCNFLTYYTFNFNIY